MSDSEIHSGLKDESINEPWKTRFYRLLFRPWEVLGLILVLLLILAMLPSQSIKVLEMLLSWPVVVLVIALSFGRAFKEPLKKLIESNREGELCISGSSFKWKNVEFAPIGRQGKGNNFDPMNQTDSTQVVQGLKDASEQEKRLLLRLLSSSEEEKQKVRIEAESLLQQRDQWLSQAFELLEMKHNQATYWWFMYLSTVFPDSVKEALYVFATSEAGVTLSEFDQKMSKHVSNEDDRRSIVRVLLQCSLISLDGPTLMRITKTGNDFLQLLMNLLRENAGMNSATQE